MLATHETPSTAAPQLMGQARLGSRRAYYCRECGYGISSYSDLPICPICHSSAWHASVHPDGHHGGDPPGGWPEGP